ncbi:TNF receptor-associated factor 3 [Lamellibrachia satsuma]|nr:TNF receptor-associated factor 3 [Lamellibrachia satsuma]
MMCFSVVDTATTSTLSSYSVSHDTMMRLAAVFKEVHNKMVESAAKIKKHETRLTLVESATQNVRLVYGVSELIWKIDAFPGKFEDASKGVNPVLYSSAFNAQGYKMALSLCPYGDGRAKGKYMSVFFVILRGQNDGTLDWPFHYSVTFSLLGQSDSTQVDDLAITFVPNPIEANIGFLGRPTTARNHMLGLPQFVAHTDLWKGDFVKDDAIFIRVQVHHRAATGST